MAAKNGASPGYVFKGPKLIDRVAELLAQHGYKGPKVQRDFNVGYTWYSENILRRTKIPSVEKLQEIYELLTGEPLIK